MARGIKILTLLSGGAFLLCLILRYFLPVPALLSLCITFGVFTYHFAMRLAVGYIINSIFHNNVSYSSWWFKERKFEKRLYKFLRVKSWKEHIPTYSPSTFSLSEHSFEFLAGATCQAEVVHEVIMVLSFLPILLCIPFGDGWLFILTSVLAALFDGVFVVLQRYNRPRLVKLISKADR